jgi:Flp pilus assembly protein TadG
MHTTSGTQERGSVLVEFVLLMPIMLLVLFGVLEVGFAFSVREGLVSAAAEAARVGTQSTCPRPSEAEVLDAARTTLESSGLDPSLATIDLENAGGESGTEFTAIVSYALQFPVIWNLLHPGWLDNGEIKMSVEIAAENE